MTVETILIGIAALVSYLLLGAGAAKLEADMVTGVLASEGPFIRVNANPYTVWLWPLAIVIYALTRRVT